MRLTQGSDTTYLSDRQACVDAIERKDPGAPARLQALVTKYPQKAEAHYLLSKATRLPTPTIDSLKHAALAVQLDPRNILYLVHLGIIYSDLNLQDLALPILRKATQLKPDHHYPHFALGQCLQDLGLGAEAARAFEQSVRCNPPKDAMIQAEMWLANSYATMGKAADAERLFWKVHGESGEHSLGALCQIAMNCKDGTDSKVGRLVEVALKQTNLPPDMMRRLHLAKGALLEHDRAYDAAFEAWEKASAIVKLGGYRLKNHADEFERIVSAYGRGSLEKLRSFGHASDSLVIIAGMPRSGTTLTEQIIASHPQAQGVGEFTRWSVLSDYFLKLHGQALASGVADTGTAGADVRKVSEETMKALLGMTTSNPRRIVEKLPHNFMYIGFQLLLFPRSRFIHVRRNPLDTFLSSFKANLNKYHGYAYDQVEYAKEYKFHEDLMDHWKGIIPDQILTVHYEELVLHPKEKAREIVSFCGLDWDDRCLEFYKAESTVKTLSKGQIRSPISAKSVGRWKLYERQLEPLKRALDGHQVHYQEFRASAQ